MKLVTAVLGFVGSLLVASEVGAESWSKQLSRKMTGDQMYAFMIQVERLKDSDLGEFLQFHVTVKGQDLKELPKRSRELRVFDGKEFISSCEVQPIGREGERKFSFRVAAKYAEKSTFTYAQSSDFDHISYWFYLKDFVESK